MFDINKPYKVTRIRKDNNDKHIASERDLVYSPVYDSYIVKNEKPYWKSSKPKSILELNKNADWSSFTNID